MTLGLDKTREKIEQLKLPADLTGKSVIDIGAWNGGLSFECERRGAARVLATDWYCWNAGTNTEGRRGFDVARRALGSRVQDLEIKVEDISPETVCMFDVVLLLGVLYHAEDPLGYLRRVRSICKGSAIIETAVDLLDYPRDDQLLLQLDGVRRHGVVAARRIRCRNGPATRTGSAPTT